MLCFHENIIKILIKKFKSCLKMMKNKAKRKKWMYKYFYLKLSILLIFLQHNKTTLNKPNSNGTMLRLAVMSCTSFDHLFFETQILSS